MYQGLTRIYRVVVTCKSKIGETPVSTFPRRGESLVLGFEFKHSCVDCEIQGQALTQATVTDGVKSAAKLPCRLGSELGLGLGFGRLVLDYS
jgi:hypothetical protein